MPQLLRDGIVQEDDYLLLTQVAELAGQAGVLLPITEVLQNLVVIEKYTGRLGVIVQPETSVKDLLVILPKLSLVAVNYPLYTDGRGHSKARILRDKYHFRGEIRAIGDVFKDTVYYLHQCGFNSFLPRSGETVENLLAGLMVFSEGYQQSSVRSVPLYHRRTI